MGSPTYLDVLQKDEQKGNLDQLLLKLKCAKLLILHYKLLCDVSKVSAYLLRAEILYLECKREKMQGQIFQLLASAEYQNRFYLQDVQDLINENQEEAVPMKVCCYYSDVSRKCDLEKEPVFPFFCI